MAFTFTTVEPSHIPQILSTIAVVLSTFTTAFVTWKTSKISTSILSKNALLEEQRDRRHELTRVYSELVSAMGQTGKLSQDQKSELVRLLSELEVWKSMLSPEEKLKQFRNDLLTLEEIDIHTFQEVQKYCLDLVLKATQSTGNKIKMDIKQ